MAKKLSVFWVIETIVDCVLISTLWWVRYQLTFCGVTLDVQSALFTLGVVLLIVNFVLYPKAIKAASYVDYR